MDPNLDFSVPLWAWFAFSLAVAAMLAVDLILHRDEHVISFRKVPIWVSLPVIGLTIAVSIVASLVVTRNRGTPPDDGADAPTPAVPAA